MFVSAVSGRRSGRLQRVVGCLVVSETRSTSSRLERTSNRPFTEHSSPTVSNTHCCSPWTRQRPSAIFAMNSTFPTIRSTTNSGHSKKRGGSRLIGVGRSIRTRPHPRSVEHGARSGATIQCAYTSKQRHRSFEGRNRDFRIQDFFPCNPFCRSHNERRESRNPCRYSPLCLASSRPSRPSLFSPHCREGPGHANAIAIPALPLDDGPESVQKHARFEG